jgi:amidophosphoribosyltransferase
VYFARPDSRVHGDVVQYVRHKLGVQLAKEHPVDADFVTPIPDSGLYAAQGYAEESKIKYKMAYVRNHYVGRTFIQPSQDQRSSSVEIKLAVLKDMVRNKRVIVVDDSVIRGTTSRSRIRLLKDAGAKEVHLRVSCPPTKHGCYYGIDFPNSKDLIASNHTIEEIRKHIGVDTWATERRGHASASGPRSNCTACWTGKYPCRPWTTMDKESTRKAAMALPTSTRRRSDRRTRRSTDPGDDAAPTTRASSTCPGASRASTRWSPRRRSRRR